MTTPLDDDGRALVERYLGAIERIGSSYAERCDRSGDRLDFQQVALVGACQAAQRFDDHHGADFIVYAKPWVGGRMADHKRWLMRLENHPDQDFDVEDKRPDAARDADEVDSLLQRLPCELRVVGHLLYREGLSQDEAAARLGVSKGYLSRLAARVITRLKRFAA